MQIKFVSKHGDLAQIYSSGPELCFLSEDNEQCHDFVMCKDYLTDVFWASLHNRSVNVYGINYNGSPKVNLKQTSLLFSDKSLGNFKEKFQGSLDLINQVGAELGIEPGYMELSETQRPGGYPVAVFQGSPKWQIAAPVLSLCALLMRIGLTHTPGCPWRETFQMILDERISTRQRHDRTYIQYALPGIDYLIANGLAAFQPTFKGNWPVPARHTEFHRYGGIIAFATGRYALHDIPGPAKIDSVPDICFS